MNRGGVNSFYHTDGLGSIVDLTDNLGAIVQSYVYDSFGNIVLQNGSLLNPYTYTGREFDSESGLYYYRSRYYDSSIGRFLSEDPLLFIDSINLYLYVTNNPINFVDPLGSTKGGKKSIRTTDPLAKNADTIRKALKNPNISNKRKAVLRAILKTGRRKAGGKLLRVIPIIGPIIGPILDIAFPPDLNADEEDFLDNSPENILTEDLPADETKGGSPNFCPIK